MAVKDKKRDSGKTIQEKANVLWDVANSLAGLYTPHEYGLVILPMAVVKRFHDCLLPTYAKVQKEYAAKKHLQVKEAFLKAASGYNFYNTSKFTFETLLADPKNIAANFRDYLNGFSENVRDVLEQMKFEDQITTMEKGGVLYQVISDFNSAKADMSPEKVATNDMGYIFENLVARFSESYDEQAGAHFTSRDIIYLMCDLLTVFGTGAKGASKTVYDMTMGTSQMLTCMEDRLREVDSTIEVTNFGQEFNPFTFGIAKADMLIRGGNPDNMRYGNTLSDDKFGGFKFDYVISNPPFGIDWKVEAKDVEAEAAKGDAGRFGPGLPSKSDGQMLFLLNGISKLKDDGRMAIIQNGSSLFSGDAGSGPSEIRKSIIDLLLSAGDTIDKTADRVRTGVKEVVILFLNSQHTFTDHDRHSSIHVRLEFITHVINVAVYDSGKSFRAFSRISSDQTFNRTLKRIEPIGYRSVDMFLGFAYRIIVTVNNATGYNFAEMLGRSSYVGFCIRIIRHVIDGAANFSA